MIPRWTDEEVLSEPPDYDLKRNYQHIEYCVGFDDWDDDLDISDEILQSRVIAERDIAWLIDQGYTIKFTQVYKIMHYTTIYVYFYRPKGSTNDHSEVK